MRIPAPTVPDRTLDQASLSSTPRWRAGVNLAVSAPLMAAGVLTAPRLLVGLSVAAAVGASCEALAPLHDGSRSFRAYATDLTHAIGNRLLILPPVALALDLIGPVVREAVPDAVPQGVAALPTAAQVALLLVVADFTNYLAHRALHRVGFLWSFHAVHHSSEQLDWLATSRGHPLDLVFNLVAITLPTYALGQVAMAPWLVTFFFLYPFVCHANAGIRIPAVGRVLVTPAFHHWHHAADTDAYDKNFGAFLSIWDRLFGTALERDEFPDRYGTDGDLGDADYVGHLVAPLREAAARAIPTTR